MIEVVKLRNGLQLMLLLAFILCLNTLSVSLSGIVFTVTFIILSARKVLGIQMSLLYLIVVALAMNFLRLLNIANFVLLLLVVLGVVSIWLIWRQNTNLMDLSGEIRPTTFINYILPIFLLVVIVARESESKVFFMLTKFGYDQVGHFAMSKALSACKSYVTICDPNSATLPYNYMYYPQQWHILFSIFINNKDLKTSMSSYIAALLVSSAISFYLLYLVYQTLLIEINTISEKICDKRAKIVNLIFALVILIILALSFLGYPNFILSASLFLAAITFSKEKSLFQYFLLTGTMMLVVATYTLFLVPAAAYLLYISLRWTGSGFRLVPLVGIVVFALFTFRIISIATSRSHLDYISIGAGLPNPFVLIAYAVSIASLVMSYAALKKAPVKKSGVLLNLFGINLFVSFSLFGIQGILISNGTYSGYYLQKMAYFALLVSFFTISSSLKFYNQRLGIPLSRLAGNLHSPLSFVLTMSILLLSIPQVYRLYSYLPLRSPISNVKSILIGPNSSEQKTILTIFAASEKSISSQTPVVVLSNNSGPDTQWVNSLSGYWSGYMNVFLEDKIDNEVQFRDGNFQKENKGRIIFYDSQTGVLNE
jgi:hypothetical protein